MTVVTRFAPSPTGYLHIGGARTALFCWLYARHMGGKFLLRIEDTDKERSTQAAVDAILDGLSWLGLSGDEPPVLQSAQAWRHREVATKLVEKQAAYRCYVTPEELDEQRTKVEAQRKLKSATRDRLRNVQKLLTSGEPDRNLSFDGPEFAGVSLDDLRHTPVDKITTAAATLPLVEDELKLLQNELQELSKGFRSPYRSGELSPPPDTNAPYVIRLKMDDDNIFSIRDRVQGFVRIHSSNLDDLVLLRSDGTPTYMLAVVVDDHDMGVTHVIRGDDHLTNTFRQLPIIDAMEWTRPEYAHVPMIHGPDGHKLSKRHGATGVEAYRDELGYLPEAMRNYLLRLGWSHGDDEIIPNDKAIEWFDLDGLNKAPARLDFAKLDSVNKHYMALADDARLFALLLRRPEMQGKTPDEIDRIRAAMPALKARAANIVQLAEQARFLTDIRPIQLTGKAADQVNDEARGRLAMLLPQLEALTDWSEPVIKAALTQYCEQNGISLGKIGPVLRAVLTGGAPSPDIALVLALLGRNEAFARIRDHARAGG